MSLVSLVDKISNFQTCHDIDVTGNSWLSPNYHCMLSTNFQEHLIPILFCLWCVNVWKVYGNKSVLNLGEIFTGWPKKKFTLF